MPNDPELARPEPAARHLTEGERAVRAWLLGVALGVFLRLVSRRRSA